MISDYDSPADPALPKEAEEGYSQKLMRHRSVPYLAMIEGQLRRFSPGERLVLYLLTALLAVSAFALLAGLNSSVSTIVPSQGGTLTEGVIGPARFINPLLALSQPDADLTTLVYSGLMRALPDGRLVPDLASSYEISEDGTTYTFKIREDAVFHNGTSLTSADVLFTIQKAQSPDIKSQRRADWEGVAVSAPDPSTIVFKLPRAYAPFLENTTIGILPKTLWESVSAEDFPFNPLNTHPVGSGPYRIDKQSTDSTGAALSFELVPFERFALGKPYLKRITLLFYPNETALLNAYNAGRVDSFAGISPAAVQNLDPNSTKMVRVALPRSFGVFFNQSKNPVLADAAVRAALNEAVDKSVLVDAVLEGYGVPIDGPIPPRVLGEEPPATPAALSQNEPVEASARTEAAREILRRGGWKWDDASGAWTKGKSTLSFALATADEPELSQTADIVAAAWRAMGAQVDVHVYSLSELNTAILRPRNYDAVLFGEVVGRSLDLFAFWHSSQRNDPGLNLSLYANSRADALLAEARATTDKSRRTELYQEFESVVEKDQPAVFLYAPEFIYIVPEKLRGVALGSLTSPSERFLNVYEWYTDTERVWNIFTDKTDSTNL
ncbi:MAG: hypothetical protein HYS26_02145 [Candidatus Kaiserbacteria bacterium]|nr:MAG: hypothetical protein HYS26_02145 [Candidatus Kaiserbacteria bacterium]